MTFLSKAETQKREDYKQFLFDRMKKAESDCTTYQALCNNLKKQVELIKAENKEKYVVVQVPRADDQGHYQMAVAGFIENSFLLFYFTQLQRSVLDEFMNAGTKELSEFYRGKLACINMIIDDARKAKAKYESLTVANNEI